MPTEVDDEEVVEDTRRTCPGCHERIDPGREAQDGYYGEYYHRRCTRPCARCVTRRATENLTTFVVEGEEVMLCEDCHGYCDHCGSNRVPYYEEQYYNDRHDEWRCEPCGGGTRDDGSIEGYSRTRAVMWLKTAEDRALTKEDRMYLGFELEIHTSNYTAGPIKDWAAEHLGDRNAISCKEDSSVSGFEIVSQPMTPDFFEQVDWDSFFSMLNEHYPLPHGDDEPTGHGLHVHVGRRAFGGDDIAVAAYAYLLSQGTHLDRIARRDPSHYCLKVAKPVSVAIVSAESTSDNPEKFAVQANRARNMGYRPGRDAINLGNEQTVEIRAFKSTRVADELRNAVRVTYVGAEYVRSLRMAKVGMSGRVLHWAEFAKWVKSNRPAAFKSISGN